MDQLWSIHINTCDSCDSLMMKDIRLNPNPLVFFLPGLKAQISRFSDEGGDPGGSEDVGDEHVFFFYLWNNCLFYDVLLDYDVFKCFETFRFLYYCLIHILEKDGKRHCDSTNSYGLLHNRETWKPWTSSSNPPGTFEGACGLSPGPSERLCGPSQVAHHRGKGPSQIVTLYHWTQQFVVFWFVTVGFVVCFFCRVMWQT